MSNKKDVVPARRHNFDSSKYLYVYKYSLSFETPYFLNVLWSFQYPFIFKEPGSDDGIKCFSCGRLGYHECEDFDTSNPDQVKNCKKDEVCMIYSWQKTQNERGN